MKKFTPAITIWTIECVDVTDRTVLISEYFLFYNRAKRYFDRISQEKHSEDVTYTLGGDTLWLW